MKRIVLILLTALAVLSAGPVIAYKNTASLVYGEAQLMSKEWTTLTVMDYEIDIIKLKHKAEKALEELSGMRAPI